MKLKKIIVSQCIRLFEDEPPSEEKKKFYIGDATKALEQRYRFLQSPARIEDFNLKTGVTFLHGIFKKDIIINKFQVYSNGVFCEAHVPTEVCDEFLDDVTRWAQEDFGLTVKPANGPNLIYLSSIEVESTASLNSRLSEFSSIGKLISDTLMSYGYQVPAFEVSHLGFECDPSGLTGVKPTLLSFERRLNEPFASGVYFSTAPLKTRDHLAILNEIEKILAD